MALSLSLRLACVALLVDGSAGLSLTLKYFDARGAAEISRVLLALGLLAVARREVEPQVEVVRGAQRRVRARRPAAARVWVARDADEHGDGTTTTRSGVEL